MGDNRIVVSPALYRALGIDEEVDRRVAERCAPLVEALESIARNTKGTDDFPIYIAQRALRAHREREGA